MMSWKKLLTGSSIPEAEAHCDGPCGVYDPASARIAAEAVLSMTKKLKGLQHPSHDDASAGAHDAYINTFVRYVAIKEEQAEVTKREICILWTDYFKPEHLQAHPNLHDVVWKATKLCSASKQEINEEKAAQLLAAVKQIHEIFWKTKNREVPWYTAS
jgi:nickel superoxide dismutase